MGGLEKFQQELGVLAAGRVGQVVLDEFPEPESLVQFAHHRPHQVLCEFLKMEIWAYCPPRLILPSEWDLDESTQIALSGSADSVLVDDRRSGSARPR